MVEQACKWEHPFLGWINKKGFSGDQETSSSSMEKSHLEAESTSDEQLDEV